MPETAVFDKTSRLLLVVVALMLLPMVLDIHAEDMPKEDVPKCVRWVVVPIRYPSRRYAESTLGPSGAKNSAVWGGRLVKAFPLVGLTSTR